MTIFVALILFSLSCFCYLFLYFCFCADELANTDATSGKRRSRRTPDREVLSTSAIDRDNGNGFWDEKLNTGSKRSQSGAQTFTQSSEGTPLGDTQQSRYFRPHDDDFSNYNNHASNINRRYNNGGFQEKRFLHTSGHQINAGYDPNFHGYHNRNGGIEPRPYKSFDRERQRYYNKGYNSNPLYAQFDRFNRTGGGELLYNGPTGYYGERRRPAYTMNGNPRHLGFTNYDGSAGSRQRWTRIEETPVPYNQQNDGLYTKGGSRCNGQDSGNGYEGGSSETQSEPEERGNLQPVQSIFIDNGNNTCTACIYMMLLVVVFQNLKLH